MKGWDVNLNGREVTGWRADLILFALVTVPISVGAVVGFLIGFAVAS